MEVVISSCFGPLFEIQTTSKVAFSTPRSFPFSSLFDEESKLTTTGEKENENSGAIQKDSCAFTSSDQISVSDFLGFFFPQLWKKFYKRWLCSIEELTYLQYVSHVLWKKYRTSTESLLSLSPSTVDSERPHSSSDGSSCRNPMNPPDYQNENIDDCKESPVVTCSTFPQISDLHFSSPIPLFNVILEGENVQKRFQELVHLHQSSCFLYRVLSWNLHYVLRHGGSQFGALFIGYPPHTHSARSVVVGGPLNGSPTLTKRSTVSLPESEWDKPAAEAEKDRGHLFPSRHHGEVLFFSSSSSSSTSSHCFSSLSVSAGPSSLFSFSSSPNSAPPPVHGQAIHCEGKEKKEKLQKQENPQAITDSEINFSLYTDRAHSERTKDANETRHSHAKTHIVFSFLEEKEAMLVSPSQTSHSCKRNRTEQRKENKGKSEEAVEQVETERKAEKERLSSSSSLTPFSCPRPPALASLNAGGASCASACLSSDLSLSKDGDHHHVFSFRSVFSFSSTPSSFARVAAMEKGKNKGITAIPHWSSSFSPSEPDLILSTTLELHRLDAIRADRVARSVGKRAYWCGLVDHRNDRETKNILRLPQSHQEVKDSTGAVLLNPLQPQDSLHDSCSATNQQERDRGEEVDAKNQKHNAAKGEEKEKMAKNASVGCPLFRFSTAEFFSSFQLSTEEVAVVVLPIF